MAHGGFAPGRMAYYAGAGTEAPLRGMPPSPPFPKSPWVSFSPSVSPPPPLPSLTLDPPARRAGQIVGTVRPNLSGS